MTLGGPGEGLLIFGASSVDKTGGVGCKGEPGIRAMVVEWYLVRSAVRRDISKQQAMMWLVGDKSDTGQGGSAMGETLILVWILYPTRQVPSLIMSWPPSITRTRLALVMGSRGSQDSHCLR